MLTKCALCLQQDSQFQSCHQDAAETFPTNVDSIYHFVGDEHIHARWWTCGGNFSEDGKHNNLVLFQVVDVFRQSFVGCRDDRVYQFEGQQKWLTKQPNNAQSGSMKPRWLALAHGSFYHHGSRGRRTWRRNWRREGRAMHLFLFYVANQPFTLLSPIVSLPHSSLPFFFFITCLSSLFAVTDWDDKPLILTQDYKELNCDVK